MISILRSNQPIAWSIVPATILLGIAWHIWYGDSSALALTVYGIGALMLAAYAHRLYVQRNFVERGDPALAWSVVAWCVALVPVATPSEGVQTWISLLLISGTLDQTLRIHRQPSTSSIQFRAAILAGLAIGMQPLNAGILLGLVLVQIRSRPAVFREWAMLVIGLAHGLLIAELCWRLLSGSQAIPIAASPASNGVLSLSSLWSILAMIIAGAFGLFMLLRENPRLTLKTKNTRYHAILSLLCLVAGASAFHWLDPTFLNAVNSIDHARQHWALIAAWSLGFICVGLIPKRERRNDKLNSLEAFSWLIFVGMLLVVFGLRLIH